MPDAPLPEILREDTFPGNTAAYAELKEYIGQGGVTAFTGAGVSVPIFPTWTALLSKLLGDAAQQGFVHSDEVPEYNELAQKDALELAELLEQAFTKPVFRARLAEVFRNKSAQATDCHRLISDLTTQGVVTLNYDNGHEIAYAAAKGRHPNSGKAQDTATLVRWMQGEVFNDADTPILHFHGDVSDPNRMVLTSGDYDQFYSQELPDQFMRQLWTAHRLLIIGFGFTDPFLTRVAERTLCALPMDTRHYALIGKNKGEIVSSIQRKVFAKKYRATPVFYEVRTIQLENGVSQDHSDLHILLKQLVGSAAPASKEVVSTRSSAAAILASSNVDTVIAPSIETDFKSDLFVAPNGNTLYAEPRFASEPSAENIDCISVADIVSDNASYVISCRPEYGATTIARRLVLDFAGIGKRALLRDAASLPNYKKKLEEHFASAGQHDAVLVLDNFDIAGNERLLKEIIGTQLFSRIILLARQNLFETGGSNLSDQFAVPFKTVSLRHLSRTDIRTITKQFYETSDNDAISAVVEKVYGDLVTLCIPITPANVVMYLTILCKDDGFQPINRVQIVSKYLSETMTGPSDAYRDVFSAKNKMDVVSAFVFHHFSANKTIFTEADWFSFCREHMKATLTQFDERNLLSLLKRTRILLPLGTQLFFKYRFFYVFFLGRHIAGRPSILADCIAHSHYLKHDGLVDVLAELASDNEPLVIDITQKFNQAFDEFDKRFIPESFDPFAELEWPSTTNEEEKLWKPLMKHLASGPRNVSEIDQIKSSIFEEQRAGNQQLVVRDFDRLERRLVNYGAALREALSNSDNLSGEVKKDAVMSALRSALRIFQIGLVLAPAIAKRPTFFWYGLVFLNNLNDPEADEKKRATTVMYGLIRGVYERTANELGSIKLGEVFKLLANSPEIVGYVRVLVFACLVRAKPKGWLASASEMVAKTGRKEFYLRTFLGLAFDQFYDEVNTNAEREELKKLIAVIRIKRDLRKDNPGEKDIQQIVGRLEKSDVFEKRSAAE